MTVPAGRYSIESFVGGDVVNAAFYSDISFVAMPQVAIGTDVTITADARTARPMTVKVPRAVETGEVSLAYRRTGADGASLDAGVLGVGAAELRQNYGDGMTYPQLRVFATPTAAPKVGTLDFADDWMLEPPDRGVGAAAAYVYWLDYADTDGVPSTLARTVSPSSMTTVNESYAAERARTDEETVDAFHPWSPLDVGLTIDTFAAPSSRVDYFAGTPSTLWRQGVQEFDGSAATWLIGPDRELTAGRTMADAWGEGAQVPVPDDETGAFTDADGSYYHVTPTPDVCPACRQDDNLEFSLAPYGDDAGHSGILTVASSDLRFYRDGVLTQEQSEPSGVLPMLPQSATYKIDWRTTMSEGASTDLDTSVDSVWTFTSKRPTGSDKLPPYEYCAPDVTRGCTVQPLLLARYSFGGDLANRMTDGVLVTPYHQADQPHPAAVTGVQVAVSFDDGATWGAASRVAEDGTGFRVTAPTAAPSGVTSTGYVSLRVKLTDASGSTLTQTIIHAYALPTAAAGQ